MRTFTVKTRSGKEYMVRLLEPTISDPYKKLGTEGGWSKRAEIEINGVWYRCFADHVMNKGEMAKVVEVSKFNEELQEALNVPQNLRGKDTYIAATSDWHMLYNQMLEDCTKKWKEDAEKAVFSKVTFSYHTTYKYMSFDWDSELSSDYIAYNSTMDRLKDALKYVDNELLKKYLKDTEYGDYSIIYHYEIPFELIQSIISLSLKELEPAKEKKEREEEYQMQQKIRKENIENGAIYFSCKSAPHNEDLSRTVLNSPRPQGGIFTIDHFIDKDLFEKIRKYGWYWDKDELDEMDMFFDEPGWRFSVEAVYELAKTNDVYVNNKKI